MSNKRILFILALSLSSLTSGSSCADVEQPDEDADSGGRIASQAAAIKFGTVTNNVPAVGFLGPQAIGCTVSLVNPRVILTAAHCLGFASGGNGTSASSWPNFNYRRSSESSSSNTVSFRIPSTGFTEQVEVGRVWVFGTQGGPNDIAVAELARDMSSEIAPLRIARSAPRDGDAVTVYGYGGSEGTSYDGCGGPSGRRSVQSQYSTTYSGGPALKNDPACGGDSGGPIINRDGDIVGVVSGSNLTQHVTYLGDPFRNARAIGNAIRAYGRKAIDIPGLNLLDIGDILSESRDANGNPWMLSAENGGGGRLTMDRIHNQEWETFKFISLGGGWYALQTYDGHFVSAINGGGAEAVADREVAREWETFYFTTASGPWGAEHAVQSWFDYYLRPQPGSQNVDFRATGVGAWERLYFGYGNGQGYAR